MKKNTLQKMFAVALTGAMVVGALTGCGNDAPATNDTPASQEANTQSEAPAEVPADFVAGIDGYTAFDNNVELKIAVYDRGREGIDPVTKNGYTEYVQAEFGDKYNVTMTFVPINRSDVMTDYALLAAAGDLPTILMEYDYPKVTQWANDGYLQTIDLNEFRSEERRVGKECRL